ncbi:hypothetical protein Q5H92_14670 [Hymenobacter sp. M29]|uniref:Uncharacterized protein n=1 Tax=Hymenobacter mellowenesis TaxID=3063995 RepID=A0ABT9AE10_9BACT|nr:hypothetical protein [Hymenobacter sp. M29]MDO7847609.1 hypothetical protein [Hymenobacter sp. M29]
MKYTINKGSFSPKGLHLPGFGKASPASRTYTVNFSQSAWYEPSEGWNVEKDWNKLCGWSIGWLPWKVPGKPWYKPSSWEPAHHKNSVRVGWRASGTKEEPRIELCLYTYSQGVRTVETLLQPNGTPEELYLDMTYELELAIEEGHMEVGLCLEGGGYLTSQSLLFPEVEGPSYSLKPYFGGSNPAPHTMTIEVTQQS